MVSLSSISTLRGPGFALYGRLVDALSDPQRRYRTVAGLALVYGLVWAAYAIVAKSSQGLNADMAEMLVWSRELGLGYPKHPPLLAWVLAVWFAVFPLADWAYYLLSGLTLGAGLYAAFLAAGIWLDGAKRAAVPFVLALIPFYNFLGLKFDQNSALIPLWGLTIWAFMRSIEDRRLLYAALAGLFAAAAMLTKYWSAFLVLSLALAVLADRRRSAYFRSPAPWITVLVGALAVAPHAYWLWRESFPPLTWVATRRVSASAWDALRSLGEYSFGTLAYAGVAIVVVLLFVRPSAAAFRDGLCPRDSDRRTAAIAFWGPILVPIAVALGSGTNLLSLWNIPALNLLPVMLFGSPKLTVTRDQVARIAGVAAVVPLIALLAAPVVAFATLRTGVENDAAYARPAAAAVEAAWKRMTAQPLKVLAGPFGLVSTAAAYLPDRPATFADFSSYLSPWLQPDRMGRDGMAIVCPVRDQWCTDSMRILTQQAGGGQQSEIELTPRWLGFAGSPQRFAIGIVPPRP
jgi:4-amino-4-deoxy-L-arabinose transferase-like glycosyltransferase